MKKILCLALLLVSIDARSASWTSDFTITAIYVAGINNFQYRVHGMPAMPFCTNASNWAYINEEDAGAKGFILSVYTAFTTGRPIRVLVEVRNGYCHIEELFLTA